MAEIQLGNFILFLVFPIAAFAYVLMVRAWSIPKYIIFLIVGLFGLISLGALTLIFLGETDVVYASGTSILVNSTTTGAVTNTDAFYDVQSSNADLTINAVSRSIMAEFPSTSSSTLDGEEFNCMSVYINKVGSPPVSSYVYLGVFDGSSNLIKEFGRFNVTEIGTAYNWYQGCLAGSETWTISATNGDRIGVMYDAGNSTNSIQNRRDSTNPYDGTITFIQNSISGTWSTFSTANDMTMILELANGSDQTTTNVYEQNNVPIIDSYHQTWTWVFFALTAIWGLMYLYLMLLPFMGGLG